MKKYVLLSFFAMTALATAQGKQIFTGIVTDDNCPKGDHSQMRMGPTDSECSKACIEVHGAVYGLYDGKSFYALSDQKTPANLVGRKVRVVGVLDNKTKTIQVGSIVPTK